MSSEIFSRKKNAMTHEEELNRILSHLDHHQKKSGALINLVDDLNMKDDFIRLEQMLRKLVKDGFAETSPLYQGGKPMEGRRDVAYLITYDGRIFIENGGYVQQKINNEIILQDTKSRLQRAERNEVLLVITGIGLIVVEILTHWNELMNLFCH